MLLHLTLRLLIDVTMDYGQPHMCPTHSMSLGTVHRVHNQSPNPKRDGEGLVGLCSTVWVSSAGAEHVRPTTRGTRGDTPASGMRRDRGFGGPPPQFTGTRDALGPDGDQMTSGEARLWGSGCAGVCLRDTIVTE